MHGVVDDDPLVTATVERRLPTVAVDAPMIDGVDFIGIDDGAAAETAVRHLIDLGHRELGSSASRAGRARQRRAAAVRRMRARGRRRGRARISRSAPRSAIEAGRAAAHELLDRAPCTALFAFSDPLALGAKLAAKERGLSVPADLSIVGFDGTAPASEGLTSVHQPQRRKGRLAADRLVAALGADPPPPRRELLPTRLVEGTTTGPPR